MEAVKFYKYIIAGLLLLNLGLLAFLMLRKPPHPPKHLHGPKNAFVLKAFDLLQLDENQKTIFKQLAKAHHLQMNRYDSTQVALLPSYFEQLNQTKNTEYSQEVLDQISNIERQKVETTYQHFEDIKQLLRPNQLSRFENFVSKATKRIYNNRVQFKRPKKK